MVLACFHVLISRHLEVLSGSPAPLRDELPLPLDWIRAGISRRNLGKVFSSLTVCIFQNLLMVVLKLMVINRCLPPQNGRLGPPLPHNALRPLQHRIPYPKAMHPQVTALHRKLQNHGNYPSFERRWSLRKIPRLEPSGNRTKYRYIPQETKSQAVVLTPGSCTNFLGKG
jgi:hypothetical protein